MADDGSTDNTAEVVSKYGANVEYQRFGHMGVYGIRNEILKLLKGEWFFNLDADNWIDSDFLEKASELIKDNALNDKFAFVYPDIQRFGDACGLIERPDFDVLRLKEGNYLDMNSVIRLQPAREVGFDSRFNSGQGDYDFFLSLVKRGYTGKRLPGGLLHYRVHGVSITSRVQKTRKQTKIAKRIVSKHNDFFSKSEAKKLVDLAGNRLLAGLIASRSPFAGLASRLVDWLWFLRTSCRHAEFLRQTYYLFAPRCYFAHRQGYVDVFYLFRDTPQRRIALRSAMERFAYVDGDSTQLFGYRELSSDEASLGCNLLWPRTGGILQTAADALDRAFIKRFGVGLGDFNSVWVHLRMLNQARTVVATNDNTGLPALRFKSLGLLKPPLIYISIGLPERIERIAKKSSVCAERHRKRLRKASRVIAYGWEEAEWLRGWLGNDARVEFVPFGVDTDFWTPLKASGDAIDIVSIGADPQRDFELLLEYARHNVEHGILIVADTNWGRKLADIPGNVEVVCDIGVNALRQYIARARLVVLPVKMNTYSGATTTLLQCLAMGKAVAVSRVGAIREGYGFDDGRHLRWMEPESLQSLENVIGEMLADRALCARLEAEGHKHVTDNLGWNNYVGQIKRCIAEVAEQRKGYAVNRDARRW